MSNYYDYDPAWLKMPPPYEDMELIPPRPPQPLPASKPVNGLLMETPNGKEERPRTERERTDRDIMTEMIEKYFGDLPNGIGKKLKRQKQKCVECGVNLPGGDWHSALCPTCLEAEKRKEAEERARFEQAPFRVPVPDWLRHEPINIEIPRPGRRVVRRRP